MAIEKSPKLESLLEDQGIERHKCRRTVPLEVLSLGLSRTGTASMKAALEILGYHDVYHWFNIYSNIQDADMWIEAFNAKYKDKTPAFDWQSHFDSLLGHCAAVTDAPCNAFVPELIAAYPDAKVILVEREMQSWLRSFELIVDSTFRPEFTVAAVLDPWWMGRLHKLARLWVTSHFNASSKQEFTAKAREVYDSHYAEVRKTARKSQMLEYELGSGWEPLCAFLQKDIPDVPFPQVNEKAALKRLMDVLAKRSLQRGMRNVLAVGAALAVVVGIWWSRTR